MHFLRPILGAALLVCTSLAPAAELDRSGGPFVPTPPEVVDAMLKLARVGPRDHVIDLGSGDGRIVLQAATAYKAGGVGIEIDPELVDRANAAARKLGVAERAKFRVQDVREADLSRATVLTMYLLPGMMQNLRGKLASELRPGARIVSHDFTFDGWKPDRSIKVVTKEKYDVTGEWTSDVYLWIVPAAVQGAWRGKRLGDQGDDIQLEIRQAFQFFDARLVRNGRALSVRDGRVSGTRLSFSVMDNGREERYSADLVNRQLRGEVREGDAVIARWTAARAP